MRSQQNWFKIGCIAWLILILLTFTLVLLHQLGWINPWQFPLKNAAFFFGGGGLLCWVMGGMSGARSRRAILAIILALLLVMNAIAYLGVYALTHFVEPGQGGIGIPRSQNIANPRDRGLPYLTQKLPLNATEWLETWFIPANNPQGTILLFPGNGGSKSQQLLPLAVVFHDWGYNALLVDFRGLGGSSGHTTTIGYREAEDVVLAYQTAIQQQLQPPYILYGISMGSAAILKAQGQIQPDAIILELPFARLVNSVRSRLKAYKIPSFPLAELMVFWGSFQHQFNGFSHNPIDYAKEVNIPTLILHGEQDRWTTLAEIEDIFNNLRGQKQRVTFPTAGHELLISVDKAKWTQTVRQFLNTFFPA